MAYKGERLLPLQMVAASVLEKNRLVDVSAQGVPAYSTYGGDAYGIVTARGEADYSVNVMPLEYMDKTFLVRLLGTVAASALLFPSLNGCAVASLGIVKSRYMPEPAATKTQGFKYIVPTNLDWEAGGHQEKVATRGAAAWAYAAATAGDTYYVEDEGCYVTFNGAAWVSTRAFAIAHEAGVAGDEIAAFTNGGKVTVDQLASGVRPAYRIVCAGVSVSENDNNASVAISDDRVLSTDLAFCAISAQAGTAGIIKTVCTADTITVTLSGNGGAGTVINYMVLRQVS